MQSEVFAWEDTAGKFCSNFNAEKEFETLILLNRTT